MASSSIHDKPLATIMTLVNVGAGVLAAVGTAALAMAGALPHDYVALAPEVVKYGLLSSAISVGLFSLGKGLYKVGEQNAAAPAEPIDPNYHVPPVVSN